MLRVLLSQQLGGSDCELIRNGLLKQPVNSVTSVAFSAAGIAIAFAALRVDGDERSVRLVFGALLVATGIGSALFHGPQTAGSHFLHAMTFLTTLWFLVVVNLAGSRRWKRRDAWIIVPAGAAAVAIAQLAFPDITNWFTGLFVAAVVATDVAIHRRRRRPRRWYAATLVSLTAAVLLLIVGRTGSEWCDPESLVQGHGGWHLFVALAMAAYFMATSPARVAGLQVPAS